MWSAVGGAAIILGFLVLARQRHDARDRLRVTPAHLLVGCGAGALMIAATYLLYPVAQHLVPAVVPQAVELYATFGGAPGWVAVVLLGLVVLGEELVWRGAVQDALVARLGSTTGVIATTLLYGLAVAPAGLPLLVGIALACGLFWSVLRLHTGSLVPPLVAHLLWNLVVLVLWPVAGAA